TVGGTALRETIKGKTEGYREEVLVVCPALNSPLRHWASDEDAARAAAQDRLDASLARLRDAGISARGEIGDAEPLQAMGDVRQHPGRAASPALGRRQGGELAGSAYGYTGPDGQWGTDRGAQSLDAEGRASWLDPPHFEVCELHVRPDRQRLGIGARLLDELL